MLVSELEIIIKINVIQTVVYLSVTDAHFHCCRHVEPF